jgi:2-oxoglutarate ferredoxin oxidoreductase subunit delta
MTTIVIKEKWCKCCGLCVAFCPKDVFEMKPRTITRAVRPEACIGCGQCEMKCPDMAITVEVDK